jgi:hypothetical protein
MTNRDSPGAVTIALAGALSLAVAMGIGRFAFTPMLPLMIQGGELDVGGGGWIAAANYAGYFAGALTASKLPWRAGRLSLIALAITIALTASMAPPLGDWAWAALRFLAGAASAWVFVGTAVWCLASLASLQRIALASTVYSGVGAGIALAGLACLAGGTARQGAGTMWLELAGLALVLTLPVVWVIASVPAPAAAAPAASAAASPEAGTRGLVLCYGALGFGYILPATFLPVLARAIVPDPRLFGLAWPVFGATAAASTFIAGWALRRASRLQVWSASHLLMGIGVLLPSLWLDGWTVGLSALLVGGTFMIVTMVGIQEIRARAVGDATPLVSRMTAAFALGQIAGPVASSLLLHVPSLQARGLPLALQAGALSLFASAAWLWREQRTPSTLPR